jgi:vacuolar-type H+-ATPase subunit E/Vma4
MAKVKEVKDKLAGRNPNPEETSTSIVPANDAEAFLLMEKRDEEQIVATLEGKYLDEFVYSFQQGGKTVEGLSWVGIQEAARAYGGIRCSIEKMKIDRNAKEIVVMVEAFDEQTKSSAIGASSQAIMMKTARGVMEDSFALQKAISKAQRNAKRQLLPQSLLRQWIEKHREAKSNGKNGSNKNPLDGLFQAVQETGLAKEYIVVQMEKKYGVKSSNQLTIPQITELTSWVKAHQPTPENKEEETE